MDHKMVAKATMSTEDRGKYNKAIQEDVDKTLNDIDVRGYSMTMPYSKLADAVNWIKSNAPKVMETNRKISRGK